MTVGIADLLGVPTGSEKKLSSFYLIPLDARTGRRLGEFDQREDLGVVEEFGQALGLIPDRPPDGVASGSDLQPIRLQYWPETVTYNRGSAGWQSKPIPGLSHGLVSWTAGDNPTLSFDVVMSSDHDPAYLVDSSTSLGPFSGFSDDERDININALCAWLVGCTMPKYQSSVDRQGVPVEPPPIIQVVPEFLPPGGPSAIDNDISSIEGNDAVFEIFGPSYMRGVTLSHQAYRDFYGVLTDVSITYEEFFISGAPKHAVANLTFMEVIQLGNEILPHGRVDNFNIAKHYQLGAGKK